MPVRATQVTRGTRRLAQCEQHSRELHMAVADVVAEDDTDLGLLRQLGVRG